MRSYPFYAWSTCHSPERTLMLYKTLSRQRGKTDRLVSDSPRTSGKQFIAPEYQRIFSKKIKNGVDKKRLNIF